MATKKHTPTIHTRRIYDAAGEADGYRILVDRLWPRGIKKEYAKIDRWVKDVAPSSDLRKWFNHDPEKWKAFITRYNKELKDNAAMDELKQLVKEHPVVTLVFAAKDEEHNNAMVLKNHLQ
jgi:uncharacterized protein YeaO (DUF488 family)